MIQAKRKGSRNERKVRDEYAKRGWCVVKAGGSLGLFDLICLHPDYGVELCQVKSNRGPSPAERDRLIGFQCHPSWTKVLAMVRDRKSVEYVRIQ